MRRALLAFALVALSMPAEAQFKGYFDIGTLRIAELAEPDWVRRPEESRVRYLCTAAERCPIPTAIEIKGVIRAESLPAAFETGLLAPARLKQDGEANAARVGSKFLSAEPISVAGVKGVQMEASADAGGPVYFVTRWLGRGERMLDVKVTARDLAFARKLAEQATQSLVPQAFKD